MMSEYTHHLGVASECSLRASLRKSQLRKSTCLKTLIRRVRCETWRISYLRYVRAALSCYILHKLPPRKQAFRQGLTIHRHDVPHVAILSPHISILRHSPSALSPQPPRTRTSVQDQPFGDHESQGARLIPRLYLSRLTSPCGTFKVANPQPSYTPSSPHRTEFTALDTKR